MSTDDKTPSAEAAELREKLEGLRATDPAPHVAAAKQQVADTAANVRDTVRDTVTNAAASVADTVTPPLRQGADAVRGAVASARSTVRQANENAEALSERIRDQPFLALGVAVLAGYVIGRAVR